MVYNPIQILVFFILGWIAAKFILPGIYRLACKNNCMTINFSNNKIPNALGIVFFLSSLLVFTLAILIFTEEMRLKATYFLLAVAGFTLLGLLDDFWGSDQYRGILGHFKSLVKGELTTGAVKALAGIGIAIVISSGTGDFILIPLNASIIALSVNMVNLLDLRPGRAGKGFLLLTLLLLTASPGASETVFIAATAGSLIAYLPTDLKAKGMMGDTGANALGAVLGLTAAWSLDLTLKLIYLSVLVLLHILAEKYSLSKIIAGNKVLNYLDLLGREG